MSEITSTRCSSTPSADTLVKPTGSTVRISACHVPADGTPLGCEVIQVAVTDYGVGIDPKEHRVIFEEFRQVDVQEALRSVRVALDLGINFIDTSPFYGRGMSEVLLGVALRDVPRESYYIGTKLGRYDVNHFDFSARRVVESVDVSLHRMGVDYLDMILCHDIEFVDMDNQQVRSCAVSRVEQTRAIGETQRRQWQKAPYKLSNPRHHFRPSQH